MNGSPFWVRSGPKRWYISPTGGSRPSEGSGFRGVSCHFIVQSREALDEVMGNAVAAA